MIQICLSYSYIKTSPRYNHMTTAYSFSKMPSINDPAITKFTKPYEITDKIAFQYCKDPKTDRPTTEQSAKYQFILVEDWFCYPDFQNYHGPSNLAHIIRFTEIIEDLYKENEKTICVRSSPDSMQRTNVALLISTYLMIQCSWKIDDICNILNEIISTTIEYRTEGEGLCDHKVSIWDCLLGMQLAFNHLETFYLTNFDVEDLLFMEQPRNGDLNWIVPGKILALAGPTQLNWPLSKFIKYAREHSIGSMVRLNRPHYDAEELTRDGDIEHLEMFMHDGTNPTTQNIRDFIRLVERINSDGKAVAVHCRAGLGRTGTMIAAYLLFRFARDSQSTSHPLECPCQTLSSAQVARAIIGYLRIMRPGSVLSGQPEFLESIAESVMQAGRLNSIDSIQIPSSPCSAVSIQTIEIVQSEITSIQPRQKSFSRSQSRLSQKQTALKIVKEQNRPHPVSHAGRGHAAEKHSKVQLEKCID